MTDDPDPLAAGLRRAGLATKELGLDLGEILADPDRTERYVRLAIGVVFAYIAWEKAPQIKANIYMLTSWIQGKGGGDDALVMKWYDWALLLTGVGAIYEAYRLSNYTGNVKTDANKYDTLVREYPDKVAAWEREREAYYRAKQAAMEAVDKLLAEGRATQEQHDTSHIVIAEELKAYDAAYPRPVAPVPPAWMTPTWEERALYASVAFLLALHPEIIAELVKGFGSILTGIGEIVPL